MRDLRNKSGKLPCMYARHAFSFLSQMGIQRNEQKMREMKRLRSHKTLCKMSMHLPLLLLAQTLQVHQLEVSSPLCQKLVVRSVLDDSALVEDEDHVGFLDG